MSGTKNNSGDANSILIYTIVAAALLAMFVLGGAWLSHVIDKENAKAQSRAAQTSPPNTEQSGK